MNCRGGSNSTRILLFLLRKPGDAMVRNDPQVPVIVDLYAMISIMRVVSSPKTLASAENIMHATTQAYFEPNKRSGTYMNKSRTESGSIH